MVWTSLALFDEKRSINNKHPDQFYWRMEGEFTDSLMMGLLVAGTLFLRDEYERDFVFILSDDEKQFSTSIRDLEDLDEINLNPIDQEYISEEDLQDIYPTTKPYGIWVDRYGNIGRYDFITFTRADEFMQGFISMCIAFQVDFRNYILGPPFDENGIEYNVVGYYIPPYFEGQYEEEEEEYEEEEEEY